MKWIIRGVGVLLALVVIAATSVLLLDVPNRPAKADPRAVDREGQGLRRPHPPRRMGRAAHPRPPGRRRRLRAGLRPQRGRLRHDPDCRPGHARCAGRPGGRGRRARRLHCQPVRGLEDGRRRLSGPPGRRPRGARGLRRRRQLLRRHASRGGRPRPPAPDGQGQSPPASCSRHPSSTVWTASCAASTRWNPTRCPRAPTASPWLPPARTTARRACWSIRTSPMRGRSPGTRPWSRAARAGTWPAASSPARPSCCTATTHTWAGPTPSTIRT